MLRYIREAFWARPQVPGLGRIPLNVLALLGFAILGFGNEGFWFLGIGLETAYLTALATSARYRALVDALDREPALEEATLRHDAVIAGLTASRRERHAVLVTRVEATLRSYRKSDIGDVLAGTNGLALDQLAELHLRLLAAQQNLDDLQAATDESALRREIELTRKEAGHEKATTALRESKQATLAILEKRLANLTRREQSLAEIEGDLNRIEAQVSLARENATMTDRPEAVSANIELASHLLDDAAWNEPPSQAQ